MIYASFDLEYCDDFFHYDPESDDGHGCHSVVACFWLILYSGCSGETF